MGREREKGRIGKIPGASPGKSGKSRKNRESPKRDKKGQKRKDKSRSGNPPPRLAALDSRPANGCANFYVRFFGSFCRKIRAPPPQNKTTNKKTQKHHNTGDYPGTFLRFPGKLFICVSLSPQEKATHKQIRPPPIPLTIPRIVCVYCFFPPRKPSCHIKFLFVGGGGYIYIYIYFFFFGGGGMPILILWAWGFVWHLNTLVHATIPCPSFPCFLFGKRQGHPQK